MATRLAKQIQPAICLGHDSFLSIRLFYFMAYFFQGIFKKAGSPSAGKALGEDYSARCFAQSILMATEFKAVWNLAAVDSVLLNSRG